MRMALMLPKVLKLPLQLLRKAKVGSKSITAALVVVTGMLQVVLVLLVQAAQAPNVVKPALMAQRMQASWSTTSLIIS